MINKPQIEHDLYLRVVSMTAEEAKEFVGLEQQPVDLGPPSRPERYREGARVWGFPTRKETGREVADRVWKHYPAMKKED